MGQSGLLANSVIYGLGSVANRFIGLLMLPVFTRYLTPADYGVFGLLTSLAVLLLPLFSLGVSTSLGVCYFATQDGSLRNDVIRSGQALCLASAVLLLLATYGSEPLATIALSDERYAVHMAVALVAVALNTVCLPLQLRLQFEGRAIAYMTVSLIGVSANVATSLVAVVLFNLGALGMLAGTAIGHAVSWFTLLGLFSRSRSQGRVQPAILKDLLRQGAPMIPGFAMLFVLQNGVRWPLEWRHGMDAVGIYSLGASIGAAITVVTTSVTSAWMPHALAQAPQWAAARHRIADDFLRYSVLTCFLLLLFFLGAQPLVAIFAASSFFEAWAVVGLSAASSLLASMFSMILPPVYLAKKVSLVLIAQAAAVICMAASFLPFGQYGATGAALTVLVGAATLVVAQWIVNHRIRDVAPIPFALPALLRAAMIVAVVGAVSFNLRLDQPVPFVVASGSLLVAATLLLARQLPGGWRTIMTWRGIR